MVSMRSEKSICAPPRLSEASPILATVIVHFVTALNIGPFFSFLYPTILLAGIDTNTNIYVCLLTANKVVFVCFFNINFYWYNLLINAVGIIIVRSV